MKLSTYYIEVPTMIKLGAVYAHYGLQIPNITIDVQQ